MQYRKAIIGAVAAASLLGTLSIARAEVVINQASDQGTITIGDNYVEIDGAEGNAAATTIHPYFEGYISVGAKEDGGDPGICMAGEENRAYYDANPDWKDCNEALLANAPGELG